MFRELVIAAALLAQTAHAKEPARAVVLASVIEPSGSVGLVGANAVQDLVDQALEYALDLVPMLREDVEPELSSALAACGSDVACIGARLEHFQIGFAIQAIVNSSVDPALVTVVLIDAHAAKAIATEVGELDARGRGVGDVLVELLDRVLASSGHAVGGRARLALRPEDATITAIDPAPARRTADGFVAPAGVYHVHVSREGRQDGERDVVLVRRQRTEESIALDEAPFLGSVWFWVIAGGVAVIAAGATAIALHRPDFEICQSGSRMGCP